MNRISTTTLAVLLLPGALAGQRSDAEQAAATITEADYARRIGVIADDSMKGRNTPSPGLDMTASWIAAEIVGMGLQGGASDGSFIQRYPLVEVAVDTAASGITAGGVRLRYGRDLLPLSGGVGDARVSGPVVLVSGSGNPQDVLTGQVATGAHVILVRAPDAAGMDRSLFAFLGAARSAGAASVLVTDGGGEASWAAGAARALRPNVRKGWGDDGRDDRRSTQSAPTLQIRTAALSRILQGHGVDLGALQGRSRGALRAERVRGLTLDLTQRVAQRPTSAPNVVGILRGSDPELRNEYVVFSAHMDHVGVGTPDQNGDSIFNGADDDASGTTAVVEVAEAMAALSTPPRRSILFLWVSGEEKGLWGSEYFAGNPTVPIESLVADLNADMVGRNWPDTIVAIGKEHSDLGETLERVNRAHAELGMTAIDDIWPEERFYFRSDHYNLARKGVPILFFFNGTHEDYHGRDDEPDRIDAEKASRIAKLLFYLGLDVANADDRPAWDPESYRQIVASGGR